MAVGGSALTADSTGAAYPIQANATQKPRRVYSTRWQVTASSQAVSSPQNIGLDFETTAETLVFLSPSLLTGDPNQAPPIIASIAANPATGQLAETLAAYWNDARPLQNPNVQAALRNAVSAVLGSLTQQSTQSTSTAAILRMNPTDRRNATSHSLAPLTSAPAGVQITPNCWNSPNHTETQQGLQCLDLDYIQISLKNPTPDSSNNYNFSVTECGNCDVGWWAVLTPLGANAGAIDSIVGVPDGFPDGYGFESPQLPDNCGGSTVCQYTWIQGQSVFQALDVGADIGQIAQDVASLAGLPAPTFAIPASAPGAYVVRSYSGGQADSQELADLSQYNNRQPGYASGVTFWATAFALNLALSTLDYLSAVGDIPDAIGPCVLANLATPVATIIGSVASSPTALNAQGEFFSLLPQVASVVSSCVADNSIKSILQSFVDLLPGFDVLNFFSNVGQATQRLVVLETGASPVETAIISVPPLTPPAPTVASIRITAQSSTLQLGKEGRLSATALDSTGNTISGASFLWSSSDSSIVGILDSTSAASGSSVLAEGLKVGTANVTASVAVSGSTVTSPRLTLTVTQPPLATLVVQPSSSTIHTGQTSVLSAQGYDSQGDTVATGTVTWSSSNPSAITVSSGGVVSAVGTGQAAITASAEGIKASAQVTAIQPTVNNINVSPSQATLVPTQTQQLGATAFDSANNSISGLTFSWSSNNPSVATVSPSGLVSALSAGTASISASTQGTTMTGSALIAVQTAAAALSLSTIPSCTNGAPSILLQWSQVAAPTYSVYKNGALAVAGITGTSFTDTANLSLGASIVYYVVAHLSSGGTTQSNSATVTAPATCPPPSINSISPTVMTASTSALTALTVNGNNFSTIGGHLQLTDPGGIAYSSAKYPERVVSVTPAQWVYQVNNGGTIGTWHVQVVNADGQTSNTAAFTVTSSGAPATPTGLTPGGTSPPGATVNTLTPTLSWNTSPGATSYSVVVVKVPTRTTVVMQTAQTTSITCPTLENGVLYLWSVSATNSAGTSAPSTGVYFTVTAPSGLSVSSVSATPSSVTTGSVATLSVTVNGLAPAAGAIVTVQSSNTTAFPAPSTITIPAGQSTNGVPVQAGSVNSTSVVTVTASYGGGTVTTNVTVNPGVSGQLVVAPTHWEPQFTAGDQPTSIGFSINNASNSFLSGTIASNVTWLTVNGRTSYNWTAPETVNVMASPLNMSPGSYPALLTITAPTASNSPVTVQVTMTILPPLVITTASLPTATWGQPYSCQLYPIGGNGTTWALQGGSTLPYGLTLSSSGLISGSLPPASSGQVYNFTVVLTDSSTGRSVTAGLSLTVQTAITVTTYAPSSFQFIVGTAYVQPPNGSNSMTFLVSGGTPPYSWMASGLPTGLSLDQSTGVVVGTPTQPGTFPATITATDSTGRTGSATLNLIAVKTPLLITANGQTPATLPAGTVGVAYNQFLLAAGGSNTGYQWTVQGSLPPGITAQTPSGCTPPTVCFQFLGTPMQTATSTFNFTVQVTDSLNDTAQQSFSLIINAGTPPQITPTPLTLATVGESYNATFTATGGSGSGYQWSFVGNGPDPSLQLSSAGVLSGTSTVANDCPTGPDRWVGSQYPTTYFQVQVTDSAGQKNSKQFCLPAYYPTPQVTGFTPSSIVVDGQPHVITVNGANFRNGAYILGNVTGTLPTTFVSGSALTFSLVPSTSAPFSVPGGPLFGEGARPLWVVEPYSFVSNQDQSFTIYDPVPTISGVQAVIANSSQPCEQNEYCDLVINGSGFVYGTTYTIVQTGTSLSAAITPSTPVPWNTITTFAFSVPATGTYTLQVTNSNQPGGGSATTTVQFTVSH